jgi:hypothetical protein
MTTKYTKWPLNISNGRKNTPNGHKVYQHFPLQDPPKFTQIGIFGLKTNHLATLRNTLLGLRLMIEMVIGSNAIKQFFVVRKI